MKSLYTYITSFVIAIFTIGCEQEAPNNHHVSLIVDRSEEDSYAPDTDDVETYLTDASPNDGITIGLSYVSDTPYASKYSFVLKPGTTGLLSNEDQRRKQIRKFHKQFNDSLDYYNNEQEPLRRSDIFRVVVRELDHLSKQQGERTLLIFSDLKEHSSLYSVYHPRNRQQIVKNPIKVGDYFNEETEPSKDLEGITVHIIYEPSIEDTEVFTAMVTIYRNLIEPYGGKLLIGRHTKIEHL